MKFSLHAILVWLTALTLGAAFFFSASELDMLDGLKEGPLPSQIPYLTEGWEYTVNDETERHPTSLPAILDLPQDAQRITLTTILPDTVKSGDILRQQTLLGWYRIYVDGLLRADYGNPKMTERYLYENASNMIPVKLTDADAGKELRIEAGCVYADRLALQRAPSLSSHRDLLMSDLLGNTSGMLVIMVTTVFIGILLLIYFLFLSKKKHYPILLGSAALLLLLIVYCNTGNLFQFELMSYSDSIPMSNDFVYYTLQFLISPVGYMLILSAAKYRPSRPLWALITVHTLAAAVTILLQMMWHGYLDVMEDVLGWLTLVGYGWLFAAIRPWRLPGSERWFALTVFLCEFCVLLDFYKCVGTWFPLPASVVEYLQAELPFMVFLPMALVISTVLLLLGMVNIIAEEHATLQSEAGLALLRATLAEKEYQSTMDNMMQVRRMRHDMSHHLSALAALIDRGANEDALAYIQNACEIMPEKVLSEHNFITSSFLEHYQSLCREGGIQFDSTIAYDENDLTNKTRLGVLLGNALKNAYEAAQLAAPEHRFISVQGKRINDQLVLVVKNGFSGTLDKQFRSSKGNGRGLGLSSIRIVTEESGGYLDLSHTENVFTLKAVLVLRR